MSDVTDQIKERLDLADFIGEYLPLRKFGQHWKGLCPFHGEKTPSFVVSPDRGIWHCFGCGEGGDAFTFVQKIEGLDFPASLKLLAERTGVTLPERHERVSSDTRGRLYDLLELTARFYHEILVNQAAGKQAREYLTQRGVQEKTIALFGIGYAPQQWDTLQQFLRRKGFTPAEMVAAGLVGQNDRGKSFDRFRGRIMFPIHDVQGRVVAFGGRIVPWHSTGSEGKYVNSPETQIYQKRRTVYNLHRAKPAIRTQKLAVVVEGYMDVVMLVQSGVEHVVATSGTAFTPEHIMQLQKFTTTLHFAFDADAAGQKAALSATQTAIAAGMRVATIVFPAGQDPADVALADQVLLTQTLAQPQSLIHVLLQRLASASPAEREQVVGDVLPLMAQVKNVVQQGELIQELAQALHVSEATIAEQVRAARPAPQVGEAASSLAVPDVPTKLSVEQRLVGLLIAEPSVRALILDQVDTKMLKEAQPQAIVAI